MKKIILYTKYDLRDFEIIKFNKMYEFENEFIKGSLKTFPTKKDAENYFKWNGIKLEIKDEFWEEMRKRYTLNVCANPEYGSVVRWNTQNVNFDLGCLSVVNNCYFSK